MQKIEDFGHFGQYQILIKASTKIIFQFYYLFPLDLIEVFKYPNYFTRKIQKIIINQKQIKYFFLPFFSEFINQRKLSLIFYDYLFSSMRIMKHYLNLNISLLYPIPKSVINPYFYQSKQSYYKELKGDPQIRALQILHLYNIQSEAELMRPFPEKLPKQQMASSAQSRDEPIQTEQNFFKQALGNRFTSYMCNQRNNHLRQGIRNLYGRHYAIDFNPNFKFKQQWQTKLKPIEEQNIFDASQWQIPPNNIISIIFLFIRIYLVWYYTTFRLLQIIKEPNSTHILLFSIFFTIAEATMKFYLKYFKQGYQFQFKTFLLCFRDSFFLITYYLVILILLLFGHYYEKSQIFYLLDLIASYFMYSKARRLFYHFRINSYTTPFKYYFKILDLVWNIIALEHIFTLVVYVISFSDQETTWLQRYGHPDAGNLQRYYYSLYFTSTTIFTIGYGDILPSNNLEIGVVLIMQMFGVANFSYLINEIGYTLSTMRKEEEELQHTISTFSKMCKYYNPQRETATCAKDYLISNRPSVQLIPPEEENKVLMKLNDELRGSLILQNNLNIIKSSVFFVCHWTKSFQAEMAKKLIKKIFVPNESIIQSMGKQRIYIIKSGKLQVNTNTSIGYKKNFKRLLKTIQPKQNELSSDNVYGYSWVISNKQVKLSAISKDFTCTYSIDKTGFLQCVNQNKLDIEYYFQIKDKMDLCRYIQRYEAPSVLNIRQHYRPITIFIIKKWLHKLGRYKNTRRYIKRYERPPQIRITSLFSSAKEYEADISLSNTKQIRLTSYDIEGVDYPSARAEQMESITQNNRDETVKQKSKQMKEEKGMQNFQTLKEYHKYFIRFNCSFILQRLEKQHFTGNKASKQMDAMSYQIGQNMMKFKQKLVNKNYPQTELDI